MLEVVDDALGSAAEAQKKTSNWEDVDKKVERAVEALKAYEKKYHLDKIVAKRMVGAEAIQAKDKSSSKTLDRLKEILRVVRDGLSL